MNLQNRQIIMKNTFRYKIGIVLLGVFFLSACHSLFNEPEIQSNPNAVTDVDIPTLISGTEVGVAESFEDTQVRIAYIWAGQLAGLSRQHQTFAEYIVSSNTFNWTNIYPIASQARLIQTKADAIGDKWTKGVGEVLEAMLIAKLADLYGDVPYSQAFDGVKYPTPVFDKQLDVYTALHATLADAITNFGAPTGIDFGADDFLCNGDISKWIKVANSLNARLYLNQEDYANAIASANAGVLNTSDDMLVPHGSSQGVDENLNYDFFVNNRPGDTGFDPWNAVTNPGGAYLPVVMQSRIGSANVKTNETAMYNHFFTPHLTGSTSLDPNSVDGVFTVDAPHPLVTAYETNLILAEAYARQAAPDLTASLNALNAVRAGLSTGYINGKIILAKYTGSGNLLYAPYIAADFAPAGIANPRAYPDQQSAMIYEIITQKYIVTLAQYIVFNDFRRLAKATPVIQLSIPLIGTSTVFPARYIYPQTEINTNPNVPTVNGGVADQFQKLPLFQ
jgi:hypothetical protein